MKHDKFSVVECGTLTTSYELRNDTNIEDSDYSESIENVVNSVQIINEISEKAGSGTITFKD
jgi:hypothetical protein